eukprot:gene10308-11374_t
MFEEIITNTTQERLNSWKSHFASLLGQPPNIIDVPIIPVFQENTNIITEDFTMEELDTTLKAIKNKKSPNFDNIPGEVCKSNALKNELLQICNKVIMERYLQSGPKAASSQFQKKEIWALQATIEA